MTDLERAPSSTTQLYQNSTLVNAVSGYAVDWIDDNNLLVQTFKTGTCVLGTCSVVYDHSTVYSNTGSVVASPTLPEIKDFTVVSAGEIFSASDSNIYNATTGALVRSTGLPVGAALAGAHAIYAAGNVVMLSTY
jgi:hypothetical protein